MQLQQLETAFIAERNENLQMLSLIGGINPQSLNETDHARLDEWIARNHFNHWLFKLFTDELMRATKKTY